ncbi:hypothetical protein ACLK1V_22145 [Escherichia coli]
MLKLKAKLAIISGVSGLISSGSVILKKFWNGPAPSIAEASYKSSGMAFSKPVPEDRHLTVTRRFLTIISIVRAVVGSLNQAGFTQTARSTSC